MFAQLLLALLVSSAVAERPSEVPQNNQIEFSSKGHLVGKKTAGHVNPHSSLSQVNATKAEKGAWPGRRRKKNAEAQEAATQIVDGCQQGADATEECQSLCYRIWCDTNQWGTCGEFDGELQSVSNWMVPEDRMMKWTQGSKDYAMDIWHDDLKRNIPTKQVDYYINNLRGHQDVANGGAMTGETRDEFRKPIGKIMRAMTLLQANEKAEAALGEKNVDDCEDALGKLEAAINDVASSGHYVAMEAGLDVNRALAKKLSIFINIVAETIKGRALIASTDEKVDDVLKNLGEYKKKAQANLDGDQFRSQIRDAASTYDTLKKNMKKYFAKNIKAANAALSAGSTDATQESMKNLTPLIKRMQELSPLFDDPSQLPKAVSVLEKLQAQLRKNFNEKVNAAKDALDRMAPQSEMKTVQLNLEAEIKMAEPVQDDFKDEYDQLESALAQIKAWNLLQEILQDAPTLVEKMTAFADKEDPDPPAEVAAEVEEEASIEGKIKGKSGKLAKESVAANASASKKPLDPETAKQKKRYEREKARLATEVLKMKVKVRRSLDACRCAKMPESLEAEIDKADDLGDDLGGLPEAGGCEAFEKQTTTPKPSSKKIFGIGNPFEAGAPHSSQPAVLVCLLLAPWLGMRVIQ